MKSILLFFFCLVTSMGAFAIVTAHNQFVGPPSSLLPNKVVYYTGSVPSTVHLLKNNRFIEKQKHSFPGSNTKSKGTWYMINDTLCLKYDLIHCRDRKWYKYCECTYSEDAITYVPVIKFLIVNGTLTPVGEKRFGWVVHSSAFTKFIRRCRWAMMGL